MNAIFQEYVKLNAKAATMIVSPYIGSEVKELDSVCERIEEIENAYPEIEEKFEDYCIENENWAK